MKNKKKKGKLSKQQRKMLKEKEEVVLKKKDKNRENKIKSWPKNVNEAIEESDNERENTEGVRESDDYLDPSSLDSEALNLIAQKAHSEIKEMSLMKEELISSREDWELIKKEIKWLEEEE